MFKLTYTLRRLPTMTRDEFQHYWRTVHAPLVAERVGILRIRRYVQTHTLPFDELHSSYRARNGGAPAEFDGVAELWIDEDRGNRSASELEAATREAAVLLEDERNFIDLPNSPMTLGRERPVHDGPERRMIVATTDHDRSVEWYRSVFDMATRRSWTEGSRGSLLDLGFGLSIEILEGEPTYPAAGSDPAGAVALGIEVPDTTIDALAARAAAAGATVVHPLALRPWGHRSTTLRDPNGVLVTAFAVPAPIS
jgi:uncharacterized protein (TIGR02118 family)